MENKNKDEDIEILDFDSKVETSNSTSNVETKQETDKIQKKESVVKIKNNKSKNKIRGIVIAIIIFIMLALLIYFLPNITKYITNNTFESIESNKSTTNKKYKSGIDLVKVLNQLKDDKNYIYEENIEINTIDKKSIPQKINTNLIYHFNPTKFQIDISKTISDYNEVSYEYYEKIDDLYKKYLYDVTTKKFNSLDTNESEFNSIFNMHNNILDNLISNNEIIKEDIIKTDNGEEILIQTKNNKSIFELLSFKTDRINSYIDITKIDDKDVIINYTFNKNKELLKFELELETIDAYKEDKIDNVTAININFIFRDFNSVKDILIPTE